MEGLKSQKTSKLIALVLFFGLIFTMLAAGNQIGIAAAKKKVKKVVVKKSVKKGVGVAKAKAKPVAKPMAKTAPAAKPVVKLGASGTIYIAGMGGHLAKAALKIDPTKANPITVEKLGRITLGSKKSYATHDARIDHNKGIIYSSTYVRDPDGKVHVISIDMKSGQVLKDVALSPSDRYKDGPMYCGSGQTVNSFLPVIMGYEGSIDVIDKNTMERKHIVHFDHPDIPKDYLFAHGVHSPDMKNFLLLLNATQPGEGGKIAKKTTDILLYVLDAAALEQGKIQIVKKGVIKGDASKTIAFRLYYTQDSKKILIGGRDRVIVVDANTLQVTGELMLTSEKGAQIECHDVIPTPDGKYAVLALRYPIKEAPEAGKPATMDGRIALMDVEKLTMKGSPVSVCNSCHNDMGMEGTNSVLCGLDSAWNK